MIIKTFNLFRYLLRYFNLLNLNIKINSKINFGSKKSDKYFQNSLIKSKFYFEYGSGSSSLLAVKLKKNLFLLKPIKVFTV